MITNPDIYDHRFLKALFDEMQGTYELVSTICSFGFNWRWRKELVARLKLRAGMTVCDLMAGTGESWLYVLPRLGKQGKLLAVDFSRQMATSARARRDHLRSDANAITVLEEDALDNSIEAGSMDAVICVYGTKTLSQEEEERFVGEVRRLLKDNGVFGIVEISVPGWAPLRAPYLFYLRNVIPCVGKLFLGNPDNYRMLSQYTLRFGSCSRLAQTFTANGFDVREHSFFWGCATALTGVKRPGRTTQSR
jgi:ubiquinone/menaquinone biosynthesis methyltransferase